MFKFNKNRYFIIATLFCFLVNIIFFHTFWSELFFDKSQVNAIYGEVLVSEWAMEQVYNNTISLRNPFDTSLSVLYPFGTNFASTDSGNGLFFILTRPFLSPHQSLAIIVIIELFAANLGMYLLLRKLNISKITSFLIGLAFGYTTFIIPRVGQLNYISIYVFPWFFYSVIGLIRAIKNSNKIFFAFLSAFFIVLSLYLNIYFFVMILTAIFLFSIYFFFFKFQDLLKCIKQNWKYLFIFVFSTIVLTIPWLRVIYKTKLFEELPQGSGWGGAIQYSADLFGFFIPSGYSYFLHPVSNFLGSKFAFAANNFENFVYPGLIIIIIYIILGYFFYKKKFPHKLLNDIKPFLFLGFCFWILTLGPFLHAFGKWGLTLDEGIRVIIPLPYILFHYVPFLNNVRVPGRLVIGFIFFAYIVCAFLINHFLKGKSYKFIKFFVFSFIMLFFIDHYFVISTPSPRFIPRNAYEIIKRDTSQFSIMEIPSVVRDGFVYFGNPDSLDFIAGQIIHNKPVIGGYLGRIPYYKRAYYQRNPFTGYIYRLIDPAIEQNGGLDKSDLTEWQNIDLERSKNAIDFLSLKYIVLNENEKYSATLEATLEDLGFNKIMDDKNFALLKRVSENKEFINVDIGGLDDNMYLGQGWGVREEGFRWSGKKSSVLFKINQPRDLILQYKASSFYKSNEVTIYINKNKIDTFIINTDFKEFKKLINKKYFLKGINFVYFMFDTSYKPKDVIINSLDDRDLSAKFTSIYLKDK